MMEHFQDIIVQSKFDFSYDLKNDEENFMKNSEAFLNIVHTTAVDSMYSYSKFTAIYKNILEERSNALLMDEDTVNYYHYNLNVLPNPGILYAIAYLESLLSIFGKINGNVARDLKR